MVHNLSAQSDDWTLLVACFRRVAVCEFWQAADSHDLGQLRIHILTVLVLVGSGLWNPAGTMLPVAPSLVCNTA